MTDHSAVLHMSEIITKCTVQQWILDKNLKCVIIKKHANNFTAIYILWPTVQASVDS